MNTDSKDLYDIVVLGAGIAGMGAAWKARELGLKFAVFEANDRAGGVLQSQIIGDHLLDYGANSCAASPTYLAFVDHLGLSDRFVQATAASKNRFLWQATGIRAVGGLKDILFADWLSVKGKRQLFTEPFTSRGSGEDESVSAFLSRRIGLEATEKLVDPVMGGIYAGNINRLSASVVLEKMKQGEQRYGSLLKTMFKDPPKPRKISNFKGGMSELGAAFEKEYADELKLNTPVQRLMKKERHDDGPIWEIHFGQGETVLAKQIVSALPSYALAEVVQDQKVRELLKALPYAPLRVDYFQVDEAQLPVAGFGILVPASMGKVIRGVLMGSVAFEGRAPKGVHTLTVFSNATRLEEVQQELEELLGTREMECLATKNWSQAIPQFELGYLQWKKQLEEALPEGMKLAGNYLGKVGVADVLSSGYDLNLRP